MFLSLHLDNLALLLVFWQISLKTDLPQTMTGDPLSD
nr:hypothetical protein PB20LOC_01923 [Pectobacterium parmentieri]